MNNYCIFNEAYEVLAQLNSALPTIKQQEYTLPIPALSNATIGQHVRHILEHFKKLIEDYHSDTIDYASRLRNLDLETDPTIAKKYILEITDSLEKENKLMQILTHSKATEKTETFYFREVLYNIEHCVHHLAIIKIGLYYLNIEISDETFGVAKSTLRNRETTRN